MDQLKAIETIYKGYRFRSRLEARWAVFFDALGIQWEYESEGYDLDGVYYLPDFWLPTFEGGMFVEVKAHDLTQEEYDKCYSLCKVSEKPVWFAVGTPDFRCYDYLYPSETYHKSCRSLESKDTACLDQNPECKRECFNKVLIKFVLDTFGIPNADQAEGGNRMFSVPGYQRRDRTIKETDFDLLGDTFCNAVHAARSARFEYNDPLTRLL